MTKQLLQSLKTGETQIVDIPCPKINQNQLLIQSHASLISAGTERMLVEFGKGGWLEKARQQPEKVKQVLEKIKTDGLLSTLDAVQSKLDQALPMGYSNVGLVLEKGNEVQNISIGDRVVSNGPHAEMIRVGKNLCAKIPDNVSDEEAAFSVLGAIALQGVRLAQPTLGESFVVIGLGLIGLLTVQLLLAQGCRVLGIDFDESRLKLAEQFGAEILHLSQNQDSIKVAENFSRGYGVDGVLITAATQSNEPVSQAAKMCRKRGRIILVGVSGLGLSRADFYEKELSFQVSCSYGPGRYDADYEEKGQDYPIGFVRWTQQRNFEAFLDLLASGKINVKPLISHVFDFDEAEKAYQLLVSSETSLGILLNYPKVPVKIERKIDLTTSFLTQTISSPVLGIIGSGNYASRVLLPAFKKTKCIFKTIATNGGVTAIHFGKKFGFQEATTDIQHLLQDNSTQAILIATQHNTHASLACQALNAGKHVFVEKPLCLKFEELEAIKKTTKENPAQILMVGFNRRFAPHIQKAKTLLKNINAPKHIMMTVNAGEISAKHWTQNMAVGGGRLLGEACHFVDLARYLVGYPIKSHHVIATNQKHDQISIQLKFDDESLATIHYLANGHKAYPKERIEIFTDGKIVAIDNFRKMRGYGFKNFAKMNLWRQDKGQINCASAFVEGLQKGIAPIPLAEIFEVQEVCLKLVEMIR